MLQQCYGAFCFRFFLFNVCYFLKVLCCGRKEAFVYICSLDVELLYLRSVITDNHHTIKTEINIYSFLFVKNIYQLKKNE